MRKEVSSQAPETTSRGLNTRFGKTSLVAFGLIVLCGCATQQRDNHSARHFEFQKDTFSFANELVWTYEYDANGKWTTRNRDPKPTYWQHCFVLARATKQFYENARFDPTLPRVDENTYRKLIASVVDSSARRRVAEKDRIVIPGYADLRKFSEANEDLLKETCGGAWQSYFQRGHWHVVVPFSRRSQDQMAAQLLEDLARNEAPVVHLVRFPQLTINHAVIVFDAKDEDKAIAFSIYDPNQPSAPRTISYDKATRTFNFAANDYFPGGRVDVYEIFRGLLY